MRNLLNIVIHACKKRKHEFGENVWPENLALFIYVSTHCVETVQFVDHKRYSQLTRWCSGNATALDARAPKSIPGPARVFI